jgi:hypothetical protein
MHRKRKEMKQTNKVYVLRPAMVILKGYISLNASGYDSFYSKEG